MPLDGLGIGVDGLVPHLGIAVRIGQLVPEFDVARIVGDNLFVLVNPLLLPCRTICSNKMRFLPWWRGRRISDPAGNRLKRFLKVLEAALTVPIYEPALRSAELDGRKSLNRIHDIESVLKRLGVFTLEQVKVRPRGNQAAAAIVISPLPIAATPDLYWNGDGCAAV